MKLYAAGVLIEEARATVNVDKGLWIAVKTTDGEDWILTARRITEATE